MIMLSDGSFGKDGGLHVSPVLSPCLALSLIGSDIWTPMEKRLFKKAFCAHKKDFYLIHKTVR